ncbi:MarR family transcriptional regulator [Hymenobacter ginsengisoli]|uniref:MarR family transcriptional regulator n=1 Tax=Hymenobacter ginsengisoli TaxID=1051626 RepID=A0ABP8QPB8_9BACT|nr:MULTISPECIES: MarR family transcriptional regulator [unclassified Hymenobacter]MBO2033093.1 MarR family transcriptional regulator [Hymenobacter sp. BT559]
MSDLPDTQHLAAELRTVVSRFIKKLRAHSSLHATLSLTERAVIKQLTQQQPLLPSELAARERVTTQAMSQILNHLAELGYITRQPSPTDKRKVLVSLSEAGQAEMTSVKQELNDWLGQALAQTCSAAELRTLHQSLAVLAKLVDFD